MTCKRQSTPRDGLEPVYEANVIYNMLIVCNSASAFASLCFTGKSLPKILGAHSFMPCGRHEAGQHYRYHNTSPLCCSSSSSPSHLCTTMITILAIIAATRASPLAIPSTLVSRDQLQPASCDDPNGCRSLWDIIRSCGFTILLCTWASVHPNIPSPEERWPRIAVRRVGLMLAALIIPEAIIAWALRQRLAAMKLAEKHKGEY